MLEAASSFCRNMKSLPELVSLYRLRGAACPDDLRILLIDGIELLRNFYIEVDGDETWKPWTDKSYLTPTDLADPDIAANVRAIDDTFEHIDFVARTEEDIYIGYWRGPERVPIERSPLVSYDTEGQFRLCGSRFVESLFFVINDEEALDTFREDCRRLGIILGFESIDDITIPVVDPDPKSFHLARYYAYKVA